MCLASTLLAVILAAAAAAPAPKAEVRNVRFSSPKLSVSRPNPRSAAVVRGQLKVDMSFARESVRMPVLRVICIVEADGALSCHCINLGKPRTCDPLSRGDIMAAFKAAGEEIPSKEREAALSDPARFTRVLPEVSRTAYASVAYGAVESNKGFFRIGKSTMAPPKVLLFRLELWQNGALAAAYDSSRTGLGAYDIPADWFAWRKYPQKFRYFDVR